MANLDTALSTFREPLLADVSRAIAESPAGSAQDVLRRGSPVDTRGSRSKGKSRRHRSLSSSSSSTSFSPSPATPDNDDNRMGRKVGSDNLAVLECPDDRFARVLDYRSFLLRNRHSTYGPSQARKMGRMAKNMKFSFGGTPMFNGKEPLKVFSRLRKFVKACNDNDVSVGMGLYLLPNFLVGDAEAGRNRLATHARACVASSLLCWSDRRLRVRAPAQAVTRRSDGQAAGCRVTIVGVTTRRCADALCSTR